MVSHDDLFSCHYGVFPFFSLFFSSLLLVVHFILRIKFISSKVYSSFALSEPGLPLGPGTVSEDITLTTEMYAGFLVLRNLVRIFVSRNPGTHSSLPQSERKKYVSILQRVTNRVETNYQAGSCS
jgi:hypothetical protein